MDVLRYCAEGEQLLKQAGMNKLTGEDEAVELWNSHLATCVQCRTTHNAMLESATE